MAGSSVVDFDLLHEGSKVAMGFEYLLHWQRGSGEVFFDRPGYTGIKHELDEVSLRYGEEDFVAGRDQKRRDIEFGGDVGF
jgi:hypothetical protein